MTWHRTPYWKESQIGTVLDDAHRKQDNQEAAGFLMRHRLRYDLRSFEVTMAEKGQL